MSRKVAIVRLDLDSMEEVQWPYEHGIAVDPKAPSGVEIDVPAASVTSRPRFSPWPQTRPIVGMFAGDGEAINFRAGPMHDWRTPMANPSPANEEHLAAHAEALAADRIMDIDWRFGLDAVMQDEFTKPSSMGQHMVTLTYIVVLAVLVLIATQIDFGFGGASLDGFKPQ